VRGDDRGAGLRGITRDGGAGLRRITRERRDIVLMGELTVIHPQAILQHERGINLDPDNKAATARAFVKFHNDMLHDPKMGGFSLLNHNVPLLLLEDAAFHKFNEMSTIGPWIDALGMLQWDYVTGAGFKGARSVRNGNTIKDAHIKRKGYMVNDKGVRCIIGYKNLGDLGGAASKAAHIEREGHMVNNKGVRCITGYKNLGDAGAEARAKKTRATALGEHHSHICISAICQKGASIKWKGKDVRMYHHCYDPDRSGLAGQKPRQVKGLRLHVCKKWHRTAKKCKETS